MLINQQVMEVSSGRGVHCRLNYAKATYVGKTREATGSIVYLVCIHWRHVHRGAHSNEQLADKHWRCSGPFVRCLCANQGINVSRVALSLPITLDSHFKHSSLPSAPAQVHASTGCNTEREGMQAWSPGQRVLQVWGLRICAPRNATCTSLRKDTFPRVGRVINVDSFASSRCSGFRLQTRSVVAIVSYMKRHLCCSKVWS